MSSTGHVVTPEKFWDLWSGGDIVLPSPTRSIAAGRILMSAPFSFFDAMSVGLNWRSSDVIGMLWLYFDESGEFLPDGTLRRLSLGGCAASVKDWAEFNRKWRAALDDEGIKTFHMTDFEASRGEFKGWDEPRRHRLMGQLLPIMNEHVPIYTGFVNYPFRMPERKRMRASYDRLIASSLKKCSSGRDWGLDEDVSIVFAQHPEFSEMRVLEYFQIINKDKTLKSCTVGEPNDVWPLQAADLFAYELMRFGKQHLGVFAEFERAMIHARIMAGLARAKSQGVQLGRRRIEDTDADKAAAIITARAKGTGVRRIARELGVGVGTVLRITGEAKAA